MKTENQKKLIWIDLEMTGLDPKDSIIIEIATIITDSELNIIEKGPSLAISASNLSMSKMDEWCADQHSRSGLIKRIEESDVSIEEAEAKTIEFILKHVEKGESPMCGNSVHQDRRFMFKYMPKLEEVFHYRNIDVSTIKELSNMWDISGAETYIKPESRHLAIYDIIDSIEEMKFYKNKFF